MLGNYIEKDSLPGDLLSNLETLSLNVGSSFLSGQVASSFAKVSNIASNAVTSFNTITDKSLYTKVGKDLVEHCVTVATNEIMSYLSDKMTEILDFKNLATVVTNSMTYWTQENIKGPAEILKDISTKKISSENAEIVKNTMNDGIENIKKNASNIFGELKEYTDKVVNSLDSGLSTITSYLSMGPDWVITKVNTYLALEINKVESFIGDRVETVIQTRNAALDSLGQTLGAMAASPINIISTNIAKKKKADAEALISQVQVKAMNAITKAVMIIRQLTGIAIPPVYPKLPKLTSLF